MSREPCLSLRELARIKGVTVQSLAARSKGHPLPDAVLFGASPPKSGSARQFRRSELLAWFEVSSK
jgi:hypothetical protein